MNLYTKIRAQIRNAFQKGFFHLLSANVAIGLLGFGAQLIVAKFLTPIELGQIRTMQSYTAVAVIVAAFGFHTAVLKLCSEQRSPEEKEHILSANALLTAIPSIGVLLLFVGLSRAALLSPDEATNRLLPLYALVVPATVYTSLSMMYLQALKKIQLMAKIQVVIRLSGFLLLLLLTYVYGIIGFVLSTILVGYIALAPLVHITGIRFRRGGDFRRLIGESFYYAKWSVAANLVGNGAQYIDIFILNYLMKDRAGFGNYSLATIFIVALHYITTTIQNVASPYFSEKSGDRDEFLRVLTKYQKLAILVSVAVSAVSVIAVPAFIHVVYGQRYGNAGLLFQILVFKYLFSSCYALLGIAIFGLGEMKYNFLAGFITIPLSITLSYVLIGPYGLIGVAIAQALTYCFSFIGVMIILRHVLKIRFGPDAPMAFTNG